MSGTIENRTPFLEKIAQKLGRCTPGEEAITPNWQYQPQYAVYQNYSAEQLVEVIKRTSASIHTEVVETPAKSLAENLDRLFKDYQGGPIIATADPRIEGFELSDTLVKNDVYIWDTAKGQQNIDQAAAANIGLSVCDIMLAESATAGFFNDENKARSVTLLPVTSFVLVPQSVIVPRFTQAMETIQKKADEGHLPASYINFISGPSNSADIEMNLVVGVHGPVKVVYLIITDR